MSISLLVLRLLRLYFDMKIMNTMRHQLAQDLL